MALINGQFFGDMKGKVGGIVMSRNKAGKVARQYIVPTDAKSAQQVVQRGRFGTAVTAWNTLSSLARSAWNTFASTIFKPKRKQSSGSYSGYQAFCSVNTLLNFNNEHQQIAAFTPTTISGTFDTYVKQLLTPPTSSFTPVALDGSSNEISLSLSAASLNATTGEFTATLGLNPAPDTSMIFSQTGLAPFFGLSFYLSTALQPGSNVPSNYDAYFLGTTGPLSACTIPGNPTSCGIGFTVPASYMQNLKLGFVTGMDYYVTMYAISNDGQSSRLGMVKITMA